MSEEILVQTLSHFCHL